MRKQDVLAKIGWVIAIVVIAIIAAIAILNLKRSRMNANEAAAIGTLGTIAAAETSFAAWKLIDADGNGRGEFGTLAQLGSPPTGAKPLIDADLATTGKKKGYTYTLVVVDPERGWTCNADPITATDGVRHFFIDVSGVLTSSNAGPADAASTPVC